MATMKIEFLLLLLAFTNKSFSNAFAPQYEKYNAVGCPMVGGRGWDNGDYLSGLGGDEGDRKKVDEDYKEFHERRNAFQERQREYLDKSPQARAFLEQQQAQPMGNRDDLDEEDNDPFDEFSNLQVGSGGGSRMAHMMAKAKRMQEPQKSNPMFQQKLAVPLYDCDDSDPAPSEDDEDGN
ncbi:unnamed protein product [Cylindrotheca closterium]|uniref:Uncharacterized protein n=1 Tax=Cylindrotheca closterium TaxID=2856 RepID=A0AAD2CZ46_9STRA|nr:unnamed protein product [Cylindrotheca closterium]